MEEAARGRAVEKYLYLPVLDLRRLRILGVFYAFHSGPQPGASGAVASVGITAQADALLRALDIRHFGSFDLSGFYATATLNVEWKV